MKASEPHRKMPRWTEEELEAIRRLYPAGGSAAVAATVDRPVSGIWAKARGMGIGRNGHGQRPRYTADEKAFIAANAGTMTLRELATALGRNAKKVDAGQVVDGCGKPRSLKVEPSAEQLGSFAEALNATESILDAREAAGVSEEVGRRLVREMGVARLGVRDVAEFERLRTRFMLDRLDRGKRGTGPRSYIAWEAQRRFAAESGWPENLPPRTVQILNLLSAHGPLTGPQLQELIGADSSINKPNLIRRAAKIAKDCGLALAIENSRINGVRHLTVYILTPKAIEMIERKCRDDKEAIDNGEG